MLEQHKAILSLVVLERFEFESEAQEEVIKRTDHEVGMQAAPTLTSTRKLWLVLLTVSREVW